MAVPRPDQELPELPPPPAPTEPATPQPSAEDQEKYQRYLDRVDREKEARRGGSNPITSDPRYNKETTGKAGLDQMLRYGHATLDPTTGMYFNVGRGSNDDPSTWSEWWDPQGNRIATPKTGLKSRWDAGDDWARNNPRGSAGADVPGGAAPADQIMTYLNDILSGKTSRYSKDVVDSMKTDLFRATEGRRKAAEGRAESDAVARGLYRSGILSRAKGDVERAALSEYSGGVRAIQREKATADFEDRLAALDRSQRWLDSQRQYLLGKESNAIQREMGLAQIQLGYAKIQAEKDMLERSLAARGGGGGGSPYGDFMRDLQIMDAFGQLGGTPGPLDNALGAIRGAEKKRKAS